MTRRRKWLWVALIPVTLVAVWFLTVDKSWFVENCPDCHLSRDVFQVRILAIPVREEFREFPTRYSVTAIALGTPCPHAHSERWHKHRYWGLAYCAYPCVNGTVRVSVNEESLRAFAGRIGSPAQRLAIADPQLGLRFLQSLREHNDAQCQVVIDDIEHEVELNAAAKAAPPPPQVLPATTAGRIPASPTEIPGVNNFAQISPTLYRGEQPTAEGFSELKKRGIKTIVNLRSFHSDRELLAGMGLQYAHIYAKAWHPETSDLTAFLKVALDPANQPVFVHCQAGSDRTGYMVASYRIAEQQWPAADAIVEMRKFAFHEVWVAIPRFITAIDPDKLRAQVSQQRAVKVERIK